MDEEKFNSEITEEELEDGGSIWVLPNPELVWGLHNPELVDEYAYSFDAMEDTIKAIMNPKEVKKPTDAITKLSKMGFKMIPEKRRCTKKKRKRKK